MNDLIVWLTNLPPETVQAAVGGYVLRLLGALTALTLLLGCMMVGAKIIDIKMRKSVDKVENHPMAFAVYVGAHFLGAALIISAAMG